MKPDVSNFEVLEHMSEANQDIRLAPLSNLVQLQLVHKGQDTHVTIGVPGDVLAAITSGKLNGGLLLWDEKQFQAAKKRLRKGKKDAE